MSAASLRPAELLRELDRAWAGLGKQESGGVLRACSMTLIILTDAGAEESALGEALADLMRHHPSRTIVIRFGEQNERRLQAGVTVQCWLPLGARKQICSEQIEISASTATLADLPGLLRGLIAADLPVVVWRRGQNDPTLEALDPLLALADKILLNSTGTADPAGQLEAIRGLAERGCLVGDLSWTRLTRWRETLAQVFTAEDTRSRLRSVSDVAVTYYGHDKPVRARYLLAWIRWALGDGPAYRFEAAERDKPCQPQGEVAALRLRGEGIDISIRQLEGEDVETRINGRATQKLFRVLAEHDLVREELSIGGRDPVFDEVLVRA